MKSLHTFFALTFLILAGQFSASAQIKTYNISDIDKIVINPHVQVTFVQGDKNSVVIESISEPIEKLNVKDDNGTLELYLDGARVYTKSKEVNGRDYDLYKGTVVKATITYKDVEDLSLRGEEKFTFQGMTKANELNMSIYGESEVVMNNVDINKFKIATYGEGYINIEKGQTNRQIIRAYGESKVNASNVSNKETKLTAYGEGIFQLNVSEELKVTTFGESKVTYKGDAEVKQGLSFGDASVTKVN